MLTDSKSFSAVKANLAEILRWTFEKIEWTSLIDKEKRLVELALEEAIVNFMTHSSGDEPLFLEIVCRFEIDRQIEFDLIDNSHQFNPLMHSSPDQSSLPIEERSPGGLGLMLMKKCMDAITYRYENNHNILTLTKNLEEMV